MPKEYIIIDGSMGEGGGQILRTALAMSAITQKPVELSNIRANRPNPGLRPQHVTGAKAFFDICGGEMEGLEVGSTKLRFRPEDPMPGSYRFDVGTAGSTTLIIQGLMPVMLHTGGRWSLKLTGGTDTLWSPLWDYFTYIYREHLAKMGVDMTARSHKRGFYPSGGGEISLGIRPSKIRGLVLEERGELLGIVGRGLLSRLPLEIWERMQAAVLNRLIEFGNVTDSKLTVEHVMGSKDKAAGITLWAEFEHARLGSDCLGQKGLRAEKVGENAVEPLLADIVSGATLDILAADQLLPVMATVPDKSIFYVRETTKHFLTCAEIIKKFIDIDISVNRDKGLAHVVVEGMK